MKDFTELTDDDLDKMDRHVVNTVIHSLQSQLIAVRTQIDFMASQLTLMNQRPFGRKTEKLDELTGQMNLFEVFNEAEFYADTSPEPDITETHIS